MYRKQYKLTCRQCSKEFLGRNGQRYCSEDCHIKANNEKAFKNTRKKVTCPTCGKEFTPWHNNMKFCSATCRVANPLVNKVCQNCGVSFQPYDGKRKFCSKECRNRWDRKTKSKSKVKKTPCEHCGFSDLRAIHRHHINRSEQKGVMCLCANHHYIFHAIVGNGKKSENLNKSEVLALLTANSVSLVENALNSPVAQNKGIVESFAGAKTEV